MDDDPPLRTDSMAMQQEPMKIGSPQFIWPKIWYSTTSTSICWILDFPLTESHNPCSIISVAMGPFSFNDQWISQLCSTPFCGADGQLIWDECGSWIPKMGIQKCQSSVDHPPIHDWLVVSTYPSEKYKSQLEWWHSQLNGKIIQMFQTTNQMICSWMKINTNLTITM